MPLLNVDNESGYAERYVDRMNLRPIGNRILVKPEANDDTTESGLVLVEHRKPETMGTVIAVGPCAHPLKSEAHDLADRIESTGLMDFDKVVDAVAMLRDVTRKEPSVKPGDFVLFSWRAGREVQIDDTGDRYLIMNESDIDAVLEGVNG